MAVQSLVSVEAALGWFAQRGVRGLGVDSRRVQAGDAFIAWPGAAVDGRQFVPQALAAGAVACLVEAQGVEAFDWTGLATEAADAVASLAGLKARTGALASGFLGDPSAKLRVLAVTGTNGKTSTTWWLAQALSRLGQRCGVIGTLGIGEPDLAGRPAQIAFTGNTTPNPVAVQAGFKQFVDAGFSACAIEATSIGIAEHRMAGTHVDTAILTNLTQDHLDYHGSMAAYAAAKQRLFAWPGLSHAVVNTDDGFGASLAAVLRGGAATLWTCSASGSDATLRAVDVRYEDDGLRFGLIEDRGEGDERTEVQTLLIGDYNVANLLGVIGGLRAAGISLADAAEVCASLTPVPGRMQNVIADAALPQVVVDYAHTPDALEKALRALQPFAAQRGGQLWCVFGCGGNRDAAKRPLMGEIAQRLAQQVVITSDNPRNERPIAILAQIAAGMTDTPEAPVQAIEDRRAAITFAVQRADARDVILIAGKGHEDTQEIAGIKLPFSDVAEAAAALAWRTGQATGRA